MAYSRGFMGCVLAGMVLVLCTGCPDTRTSNQGGGTVLTVAAKFQSNPSDPPIGDLTPDEWQVVSDNLPLLAQMAGFPLPEGVNVPSLTDEQAQDLTDFLDAAGVTSVSQLSALAADVLAGTVEVPASLLNLAQSLEEQYLASGGT